MLFPSRWVFIHFLVGPGGTKGRIFFFKVRQPLLVKICFYTSLTYGKNEPGRRIMLEFQFTEGKKDNYVWLVINLDLLLTFMTF